MVGRSRNCGTHTGPDFYRIRRELIGMDDPDNDEWDVDEEAQKIARESLEMGDRGPVESVDGECSRCDRDATWQDPVHGHLFCEEHATEHFRERHG